MKKFFVCLHVLHSHIRLERRAGLNTVVAGTPQSDMLKSVPNTETVFNGQSDQQQVRQTEEEEREN